MKQRNGKSDSNKDVPILDEAEQDKIIESLKLQALKQSKQGR
jgi:hypothetical protein